MRRDGTIQLFEGCTAPSFKFVKYDGKTIGTIDLIGKPFLFPAGQRAFRAFICHEDFKFPLPMDPIVYATNFEDTLKKIYVDVEKWKAKQEQAKSDLWLKILVGIGIAALLIFIGAAAAPDFARQLLNMGAKKTAEVVAENVTKAVTQQPVILQ